jgi:predicted porin
MKKYILTALSLLACGAVTAQSSVTIFGIVDAGIARISGTGAGHSTGMASGGNSSPRIGFRGTEDLGGGLAASFWLEGAVAVDVGGGATQTTGLDFARRSTVSLSGNFGEVRLGRDYAMTYWNMVPFDAFGQRGLGTVENAGNVRGGVLSYLRTGNSIAYWLPNTLGGFYGSVQYAFGEQPSNKVAVANAAGISTSAANAATDKTNNYYGARVGYANGPLNVSASYGAFQDAVRTVGTSFYASDYEVANLGASYDFGFIKPTLLYQNEKVGGRGPLASFKFQTFAIGATAPIGVGLVRAQVARYNQSNSSSDFTKYAVGYVHNLSKRTVLYADIARLSNKGTGTFALTNMSASVTSPVPTAGGNSTGYIAGIRHSF